MRIHIAKGSASELEYRLLLAHDLELPKTVVYERLSLEAVEVKTNAGVGPAKADS